MPDFDRMQSLRYFFGGNYLPPQIAAQRQQLMARAPQVFGQPQPQQQSPYMPMQPQQSQSPYMPMQPAPQPQPQQMQLQKSPFMPLAGMNPFNKGY